MITNFKYNLKSINLNTFPKLFEFKSGIYLWTNLVNGKRYIGSSINLRRRLREYLNPVRLEQELNRGESIIYRAMLKHGYLSFSFEILEIVEINCDLSDKDKARILQKLEQKHIDNLQPEYNILKIAGSNRGHTLSEETREKMSLAKKGKPSHRKGMTVSEETRNLIQKNSGSIKVVYMISTDGVLLNTFNSIKECESITGISRHRIGRTMKSGKLLDGKYYFSNNPLL